MMREAGKDKPIDRILTPLSNGEAHNSGAVRPAVRTSH